MVASNKEADAEIRRSNNDIANRMAIIAELEKIKVRTQDAKERARLDREITGHRNYISGLRYEIKYTHGVQI